MLTTQQAIDFHHNSIQETLDLINERGSGDYSKLNKFLSGDYIILSKLYMELNEDAEKFKYYMHKSANIYFDLLNRENIDEKLRQILYFEHNYIENMLFLAAGEIELVKEYARKLFDYYKVNGIGKGYTKLPILIVELLYRLILNEERIEEFINKFYEYLEKPRAEKYCIGFVKMMDGIYKKDGNLIESGLDDVIKYKGSIRRSSIDSTGNTDFCYWAIGLSNLAISRGIGFKFPKNVYLPHKLLMTPNKVELKEVIKVKKPKKEKPKT